MIKKRQVYQNINYFRLFSKINDKLNHFTSLVFLHKKTALFIKVKYNKTTLTSKVADYLSE
ncbi:hypothetical protein BCS42_06625 [Crenothrix sp. D3]|nr:hypothetical protein BCS42_06625 [Crenothrix sp. D3]